MPPSKASFTICAAGTRGKYGTLPKLGEDKENYDPLSGLRAALPGSSGKKSRARKPLRDVGFYPLEDPAPSALTSSSSGNSSSDDSDGTPECGRKRGGLGPRNWRMQSAFDDKENTGNCGGMNSGALRRQALGKAHANANPQRGGFGGSGKQHPNLKPLTHSPSMSPPITTTDFSCRATRAAFASPQASIFGAAHIPSPHPLSGDKCGRKIKRAVPRMHRARHNVCAIR